MGRFKEQRGEKKEQEEGGVGRWGLVKVKRDFVRTLFLYSALSDVNGVLKSLRGYQGN